MKLVHRQSLAFRPSVYAIVTQNDKILLLNTKSTGTFSLPGGGVEPGERMAEALRREVREEAGIDIEIGELVFFSEEFFHYEPTDESFHSFRFFFGCRPITMDLHSDDQVDDGEVERPRWIKIESLRSKDFQNNGQEILETLDGMDLTRATVNNVNSN